MNNLSQYTITLIPPEKGAPMWAAYCKEYEITTENETPEEALSSLFDTMKIIDEECGQAHSIIRPKKAVTFKIPALA